MRLPDEVWLPLMHSAAHAPTGELTHLRLIPSGIADGIARFAISGGISPRISDVLREGFSGLIETVDASSGQINIRLDQLDRGLQVLGSKFDERAGEIFWLLQLQGRVLSKVAEQGASRHATEARELRQLGERAYQRGDYPKARRYFRMATKVINDDFTVYRSLGHIYHRHCDKPDARTKALKCYRRAAECAFPADPIQAAELRLLAAIVLSEMPESSATGTDIDDAIKECEKALSHNERLHAARYWRAKLLSRCGNGTRAAEDLKVVIEADAVFFTQASCDPDLCGRCPEPRDVIEEIRHRAEHWLRPTFELVVGVREHWRLPPDLDGQLDAAIRQLVAADDADIHPAVTAATELYRQVKCLSRSLLPVAEVQASTQSLFTLSFSPDGRLLATTDGAQFVKLWRREGWTEFRQLDAYPMVKCLAFSPEGRFLATAGLTVRLWDVRSGREECEWELDAPTIVERIGFVRDGRWLIWRGEDVNAFGGWDVATRTQLPGDAIDDYLPAIACIFGRQGDQQLELLALGQEAQVIAWPDGAELWRSKVHPFNIDGLAINSDGRHVATGCADGVIRIWSLQSRKAISQTAIGHPVETDGVATGLTYPAPRCLAYSPDGRVLVAGCNDGAARVWEFGFGQRDNASTDAERQERVDALVQERSQRRRYSKLRTIFQGRQTDKPPTA